MKALVGVLVVLAILATTAWFRNQHVPAGKQQANDDLKQAEQRLAGFKKASAEAWRTSKQATDEAKRTWKAAASLRIKFQIIDPDPESETTPTSAFNNPDDVKTYLTAKREYLEAKAELQKLEEIPFYSLRK